LAAGEDLGWQAARHTARPVCMVRVTRWECTARMVRWDMVRWECTARRGVAAGLVRRIRVGRTERGRTTMGQTTTGKMEIVATMAGGEAGRVRAAMGTGAMT
jgi:hypothetical protein